MRRTILKYKLGQGNGQFFEFSTYAGAIPVHAGLDASGESCVWFEVDTGKLMVRRKVVIVGTGNDIPDCATDHIGSYVEGSFVWHVYLAL